MKIGVVGLGTMGAGIAQLAGEAELAAMCIGFGQAIAGGVERL